MKTPESHLKDRRSDVLRHNLLLSTLLVSTFMGLDTIVCAQSARSGISIGSLTDVVNRDGTGDKLIGYGVVSGLNGTGDDFSKSPSLAESYMTLLQNLDVPGLDQLSLSRQKSFAVVIVTSDVPYTAGLGDDLNISITSAFDAESLAGGRLDYAILKPPGFSNASAPILATVVGAPIPLVLPNPVRTGLVDQSICFTFRLHGPWASSGVAAREIVNAIEEQFEFERVKASVRADGRVTVHFPDSVDDVGKRVDFMSQVEQVRIDERLVTRNANTIFLDRVKGLVVVGAGVRFLPTLVSVEGLEHVTIQPVPEPNAFDPMVTTDSSVGLVTQGGEAGDARLRELVDQMRKLQVPVAKQIDVIISLRLSGSLLNVDVWEVVE
jgi:flagellar P-ring protein precursor FlgI